MKNLARALKLGLVGIAIALLAGAGCKSDSGSKEFIPGKGWKST